MPWDGGCFLTEDAFAAIRELAVTNSDARYLLVPMARIADNRVLLDPSFRAKAEEEPQVIFRRDARDRFDPHRRYGHSPKAEFLVRIGFPGAWDNWQPTSWEARRHFGAEDKGRFASGGWVARLSPQTSEVIEAAGSRRWLSRFGGVAKHCAGIDDAWS